MGTFYDDFERANGALGGNWLSLADSPAIVSGTVQASGYWQAVNTTLQDNHRIEVSASVLRPGANHWSSGPTVKNTVTNNEGYYLGVAFLGGVYYCSIKTDSRSLGTEIAGYQFASPPPERFTLKIIWNDGDILTYLDDTQIHHITDNRYLANVYGGISGAYAADPLFDVRITAGTAAQFAVTPNPVGNYGTAQDMTATGVSSSWTAGTPGSPAFTVDHGTITDQVVASATSATFHYDPGNFLGTATFTDPSTGLTSLVLVSSNPSVVPPTGGADTWSPYKTLVDATGTLFTPDYLLTDQSPVIESTEEVPGRLPILEAIRQIWNAHFGEWTGSAPSMTAFVQLLELIAGSETPMVQLYTAERATSIREELEATRNALTTLTQTYNDLETVVGLLGGDPTVYSNADLKTAIDLISTGSNQDVLDALSAYFGESPPTIEQLGTMVSDLATIAGYNLGDVKGWIEAVTPTVDLEPVLDKLDLIQPSTAADLTTLTNQVTGVDYVADSILGITSAVLGDGQITIGMIYEAIQALTALWSSLSPIVPPVWPGLDNVTLGTPVAYADDLTITEPMHGVLLEWTVPPRRTSLYRFGEASYYYRAGRISFGTDNGDMEPPQYLGFANAIYCPTSMVEAASVRIQSESGAEGTVTPWTRSE